jgi:hypothetical protein
MINEHWHGEIVEGKKESRKMLGTTMACDWTEWGDRRQAPCKPIFGDDISTRDFQNKKQDFLPQECDFRFAAEENK